MTAAQTTLLRIFGEDDCLRTPALAGLTGMKHSQVVDAARRLIGRGLLERRSHGCYRLTPSGRTAKAEGVEIKPGARGPQGAHISRQTTVRAKAWTAMRNRQARDMKFNLADLVGLCLPMDADAKAEARVRNNVREYLLALTRAGYLQVFPARGERPRRYLLTRNEGLAAPRLRRSKGDVYDPNNKKAYPMEDRP